MRPVPRQVAALAVAGAVALTSCHGSGAHARAGSAATAPTTPSPSASTTPLPPNVSWRIPAHAHGGIEGYADRTSVTPGQQVRLYVSTRARTFVVRAFRMGWYAGARGRLTWVSQPTRGTRQPAPSVLSARTHTMTARWSPSLTVGTAGWTPGDYLLRLDTDTGHMAFVPLTVRTPSAAGRIVLVTAVTTWQAYNTWGCCNLYRGADGSFAARSRAVSFDRPYSQEDGAGEFIERALGVLAEAERLGLQLDYATDVDLQLYPHLLDGAAAVISMGHDEYWSPQMRSAVTRARDAGTNLAFFGANDVFRRIRLSATTLGPGRLQTDYKVSAEDPFNGRYPSLVTSDWPDPPDPRPESALLGASYGCFPGRVRVAGVVASPGSWVFAGTGVGRGTRLPGLIGPETDAVLASFPTPRPLEVLLHSPVHCPGGSPAYQDTTYYVAASGAGVFDAGTIDWGCDVRGGCYATGPTARVVRQVTDNILRAFARGPAGPSHPARDNLVALGIARR